MEESRETFRLINKINSTICLESFSSTLATEVPRSVEQILQFEIFTLDLPGKRWKTIALKTDYFRIKKSFPKYQRYKLLHLADIIRLFVRRKVIIWIWTKVKTLSCNNRTLHALKLQKVTTALPSTTNLKKKRWSKFNPPYQYKEVFSIWCKYLSDFRQKVMICIRNPAWPCVMLKSGAFH